jgi:hypothetical protein
MPETITGIAVKSIDRALVTDDGAMTLLTYTGHDGREATLAIPVEQLQGLIMLLSQSLGRSAVLRKLPVNQKPVVEASSWLLNETADKRLVISIRVPGGAEMSFVLPAKGDQSVYNVEELMRRSAEARNASGKKVH